MLTSTPVAPVAPAFEPVPQNSEVPHIPQDSPSTKGPDSNPVPQNPEGQQIAQVPAASQNPEVLQEAQFPGIPGGTEGTVNPQAPAGSHDSQGSEVPQSPNVSPTVPSPQITYGANVITSIHDGTTNIISQVTRGPISSNEQPSYDAGSFGINDLGTPKIPASNENIDTNINIRGSSMDGALHTAENVDSRGSSMAAEMKTAKSPDSRGLSMAAEDKTQLQQQTPTSIPNGMARITLFSYEGDASIIKSSPLFQLLLTLLCILF